MIAMNINMMNIHNQQSQKSPQPGTPIRSNAG